MAKQYPLRGDLQPLIWNDESDREVPLRNVIISETTPPVAPPSTTANVVVFIT